jgi:cytochrome c-type biogenesis protein CcmH
MGFVWLLLLALAAAALLWRLRIARPLWSLAGAALMLGAAGYALQGRPFQPGMPREANSKAGDVDAGLVTLRDQMFQARFTTDGAFLIASDAMLRAGDPGAAAGWTSAGIRAAPDSAVLWTELGGVIAAHDGGQVSPASLFAFRHAARLAPDNPGPPFFLGIALVEAGRFAEARAPWRRALALCPAKAPYRQPIAARLMLLETFLRQVGQ